MTKYKVVLTKSAELYSHSALKKRQYFLTLSTRVKREGRANWVKNEKKNMTKYKVVLTKSAELYSHSALKKRQYFLTLSTRVKRGIKN